MTLDEMEAVEAAKRAARPALPPVDISHYEVVIDSDEEAVVEFTRRPDRSPYDIAYGIEIIALTQGICPQCGEAVELNRQMTLDDAEDTLYYDCTHTTNHKYLIMEAGSGDFR